MTLDKAIETLTQAYTHPDKDSFVLQDGQAGILGVSQIKVIEAWQRLRKHAKAREQ